jgi:hypothetical protein
MNWKKLKYIGLGSLTWVPGLHRALRRGTGGSNSARYCYSVWLRHLVLRHQSNLGDSIDAVAELGPGDSLGVGFAALLSGASRYLAFDALPHASARRNLAIFEDLVALFSSRTPIPNDTEFPFVHPKLEDYAFPSAILDERRIGRALAPERLEALRRDVQSLNGSVVYQPQWHAATDIVADSLDMIFSQAVLEHVDALRETYVAMFQWLRPGGVISHQIDFKCHSTSDHWNGHLAYSDLTWRLMRGNLPYFINRCSPSEHVAAAAEAGFQGVSLRRVLRDDGLRVEQLAPRFRAISDLDAKSAGGFLHAFRPGMTD